MRSTGLVRTVASGAWRPRRRIPPAQRSPTRAMRPHGMCGLRAARHAASGGANCGGIGVMGLAKRQAGGCAPVCSAASFSCSAAARPGASCADPASRSWRVPAAARRGRGPVRLAPGVVPARARAPRRACAPPRTRPTAAPGPERARSAPRPPVAAAACPACAGHSSTDCDRSISVARVRWLTLRRRASSVLTSARLETVAGALDGPRSSSPRLTIRSTVLRDMPSALAATPKCTSSSVSGRGVVSDKPAAGTATSSPPGLPPP